MIGDQFNMKLEFYINLFVQKYVILWNFVKFPGLLALVYLMALINSDYQLDHIPQVTQKYIRSHEEIVMTYERKYYVVSM